MLPSSPFCAVETIPQDCPLPVTRVSELAGWLPDLSAAQAFERGTHYRDWLRRVLPTPDLLNLGVDLGDRLKILDWMGRYGEGVNVLLNAYLLHCQRCMEPETWPKVSVLAAPLAAEYHLAGLCVLTHEPTLIVIDIGRVAPGDWLGLIAHEYAHAWLGKPGHDRDFQRVLNHLCLGLGLPECPLTGAEPDYEAGLIQWPPATVREDALAVWRGDRPLCDADGLGAGIAAPQSQG